MCVCVFLFVSSLSGEPGRAAIWVPTQLTISILPQAASMWWTHLNSRVGRTKSSGEHLWRNWGAIQAALLFHSHGKTETPVFYYGPPVHMGYRPSLVIRSHKSLIFRLLVPLSMAWLQRSHRIWLLGNNLFCFGVVLTLGE